MKKCFLLAALIVCMLPVVSHSYSVVFDTGTTYNTQALTGFATTGAMMDGMSVTAYFVGGGSETLAWADTGASSGGVSGTGWTLSQSGDTFSGDNWTLSAASALSRVYINAGPGDTVFDIASNGTTDFNAMTDNGTPGSARGLNFATPYGGVLTAYYRNSVGVGGNPIVGDLFLVLDLQFSSFSGSMIFSADTDNLLYAGDIVPTPEPTTMLLLGFGLIGLAGARRFKK